MPEEMNPHEIREQMENLEEHVKEGWTRYLALTTALIAVIAAVASLVSGTYADKSLLQKNEAVLNQAKASDQWSYYQAKGIKKNIADGMYVQSQIAKFKDEAERYAREQEDIKVQAEKYEETVKLANERSEVLFEHHHHIALGVTLFQIAIALSAIAAMLHKQSFWALSIALTVGGLGLFIYGMM